MKKLVIIIGGQATGKMTVGEELSQITGLKLFHNHMSVELANHFYGFFDKIASPEFQAKQRELFFDMVHGVRKVVFANVARSYLDGMILTLVMYYDDKKDAKIFNKYVKWFTDSAKSIGEDVEICAVELDCDIEERLKRNVTPNRLEKKPSKRNIEHSNDVVRRSLEHRTVANDDDIKKMNVHKFFKINNTNLTAEQVAQMIKKEFNL